MKGEEDGRKGNKCDEEEKRRGRLAARLKEEEEKEIKKR